MCVTLNPRIKIAPIRAPAGLVSYLLQNRAKNTPRAALWGERHWANVRHKFPSISHKQERCCCSSLLPPNPPLSKKTPPNPDKFVYLSLGTKSDPFLDPLGTSKAKPPAPSPAEGGRARSDPRNISSTRHSYPFPAHTATL